MLTAEFSPKDILKRLNATSLPYSEKYKTHIQGDVTSKRSWEVYKKIPAPTYITLMAEYKLTKEGNAVLAEEDLIRF